MTVEEVVELKRLLHSWEDRAPARCERCWTEAQLSSHNYESTTEAYYAAMERAEESGASCTQSSQMSPWRVCASELEDWLKTNESQRWHTAGRALLTDQS